MTDLAERTREAYLKAKNAPREGVGTGRGHGMNFLISNEWMRLATQCRERGIDWRHGLSTTNATSTSPDE